MARRSSPPWLLWGLCALGGLLLALLLAAGIFGQPRNYDLCRSIDSKFRSWLWECLTFGLLGSLLLDVVWRRVVGVARPVFLGHTVPALLALGLWSASDRTIVRLPEKKAYLDSLPVVARALARETPPDGRWLGSDFIITQVDDLVLGHSCRGGAEEDGEEPRVVSCLWNVTSLDKFEQMSQPSRDMWEPGSHHIYPGLMRAELPQDAAIEILRDTAHRAWFVRAGSVSVGYRAGDFAKLCRPPYRTREIDDSFPPGSLLGLAAPGWLGGLGLWWWARRRRAREEALVLREGESDGKGCVRLDDGEEARVDAPEGPVVLAQATAPQAEGYRAATSRQFSLVAAGSLARWKQRQGLVEYALIVWALLLVLGLTGPLMSEWVRR